MNRFEVTFTFAGRVPGSRNCEIAVDLRQDFEHVALIVATIPEVNLGGLRSRTGPEGRTAVARYAAAIAVWAREQTLAGRVQALRDEGRRVTVPESALELTFQDPGIAKLGDGDQLLTFEC